MRIFFVHHFRNPTMNNEYIWDNPIFSLRHFYLHSVEFQCNRELFSNAAEARHIYAPTTHDRVVYRNNRPQQHQLQSQQCTPARRSTLGRYVFWWALTIILFKVRHYEHILYCLIPFVWRGSGRDSWTKLRSRMNISHFILFSLVFYLTETGTMPLWMCEIPRVAFIVSANG